MKIKTHRINQTTTIRLISPRKRKKRKKKNMKKILKRMLINENNIINIIFVIFLKQIFLTKNVNAVIKLLFFSFFLFSNILI